MVQSFEINRQDLSEEICFRCIVSFDLAGTGTCGCFYSILKLCGTLTTCIYLYLLVVFLCFLVAGAAGVAGVATSVPRQDSPSGWASGAQRVNGTPSSARSAKTVAGRTPLKFETQHVGTNQINANEML